MSPKQNSVIIIKIHLEDIVFFDNVVQVFFPQFLGRSRPSLKYFVKIYIQVKTVSFVSCIHFVFSSPTPVVFFISYVFVLS